MKTYLTIVAALLTAYVVVMAVHPHVMLWQMKAMLP